MGEGLAFLFPFSGANKSCLHNVDLPAQEFFPKDTLEVTGLVPQERVQHPTDEHTFDVPLKRAVFLVAQGCMRVWRDCTHSHPAPHCFCRDNFILRTLFHSAPKNEYEGHMDQPDKTAPTQLATPQEPTTTERK